MSGITRINTNNIKDSAVTLAKIQNINDQTILGNSSGGSAAPSALTTLPNSVQDNITRLGTIVSGVWNGTTIGPTYGGTGLSTYTRGDILYSSATNVLSKLAIGSNGKFLHSDGTDPSWYTLLSSDITGALGYTPVNKAGDTMTGLLILSGDPVAALGAATKQYVDSVASGLDWKGSCRVGTTGNITLSGNQTIDGVTTVDGDRVFVKNQTAGEENGLYVADSGAWTRTSDADTSAKVTTGMASFISEGTVNGGTSWVLTTPDPIVLGTTVLVFTQFSGTGTYSAGTGLTLTGTVFSISTSYVGQTSITTLGTITTGTWQGTSISTTYTDAKLKTLTGTSNRITIGGTSTDPTVDIAATYVGQSSITTLGTVTTGTWSATTIATTKGGTGLTSYATGDILYASATNVLSKLAAGTDGYVLTLASGVPTWAAPTGGTYAYNEIPSGTINGSNDTFTLAHTPSPAGSLVLFKAGLYQIPGGVDYSLSGSTITFVAGNEPSTGDNLIATYTY